MNDLQLLARVAKYTEYRTNNGLGPNYIILSRRVCRAYPSCYSYQKKGCSGVLLKIKNPKYHPDSYIYETCGIIKGLS